MLAAGFISPDHSLSQAFISNYLDVYVSDALKRVPGVGAVVIFGERKYAMRIWLDPQQAGGARADAAGCDQRSREQNVEVPAGQLGQPPSDPHAGIPDGGAGGGAAYAIRGSSRTSF